MSWGYLWGLADVSKFTERLAQFLAHSEHLRNSSIKNKHLYLITIVTEHNCPPSDM